MKTSSRIFAIVLAVSLIAVVIFKISLNTYSPKRIYLSEMEYKFTELNYQLSMIRDSIDSVPIAKSVRSGNKISEIETSEPRTQIVVAKAYALKHHFDTVPLPLIKELSKQTAESAKWKEELSKAYKAQFSILTQHLTRIKTSYLENPKKYELSDVSMDTFTYYARKAEGGGGNDELRINMQSGALLMRNGSDFVDLAQICTINIDEWFKSLPASCGDDSALIPSETNVLRDMLKACRENYKRVESGIAGWTDSDYKEITDAISGALAKSKGCPHSEVEAGRPIVYGFDGIKGAYIVTCDAKRGDEKVCTEDNTLINAGLVFAISKQSNKSWLIEIGTMAEKPKGTTSSKNETVCIRNYKETGNTICLQWSSKGIGDVPTTNPH